MTARTPHSSVTLAVGYAVPASGIGTRLRGSKLMLGLESGSVSTGPATSFFPNDASRSCLLASRTSSLARSAGPPYRAARSATGTRRLCVPALGAKPTALPRRSPRSSPRFASSRQAAPASSRRSPYAGTDA